MSNLKCSSFTGHVQRYLQYNELVRQGLQHFDAWASTFGETVTAIGEGFEKVVYEFFGIALEGIYKRVEEA